MRTVVVLEVDEHGRIKVELDCHPPRHRHLPLPRWVRNDRRAVRADDLPPESVIHVPQRTNRDKTVPILIVMIPDPNEQATMRLDDVGEALGISRSSVYAAARSGELPVIRVGRRLLVPTAAIRRLLCLDDDGSDGAA